MVFSIILFIMIALSFAGAILSGYILHRNHKVFEFRTKVLFNSSKKD